MIDVSTWLIVFISALCLYLVYISKQTNTKSANGKKVLPGPRGLPLLGNLFSFKANDRSTYKDLMKYGDVCSVRIGPGSLIFLNSMEAAQEAFVTKGDIFSGRSHAPLMDQVTRKCGVTFTDGPVWKEHRRVMLRFLREFGVGKKLFEDIVKDEFNQLREQLAINKPVDTEKIFEPVISNIIGRLLFKERSGMEDPEFYLMRDAMTVLDNTSPTIFIPGVDLLMKVPIINLFLGGATKFLKTWDNMNYFLNKKINQRSRELRETGTMPTDIREANDICDYLLIEKDLQEAAKPGRHTFTDWQVMSNMLEMYAAGIPSSAASLRWITLILSIHPEVQRKAQREIEENIGCDRLPSMADRDALPYVSAVLDEVLRYMSTDTTSLPHRTLEDTNIQGYFIPADTTVETNFYAIHHNPAYWEKPDEFYPEHFLTAEGQYKPSKYLIPFSIGKRACPGETLARTQIFIGIVTILQVFSVSLVKSNLTNEELLMGESGITVTPRHHEIIFSKLSR